MSKVSYNKPFVLQFYLATESGLGSFLPAIVTLLTTSGCAVSSRHSFSTSTKSTTAETRSPAEVGLFARPARPALVMIPLTP